MNTPIAIDATIVSRPIQTDALTFADNPQPRCPVVLLLDCSSSMAGDPITALHGAVEGFYQEMAADPIASMSVEVCVIAFGAGVRIIRRFQTVADTQDTPLPALVADGQTPMGEAIRLGLRETTERRSFYKYSGMSAYKPWMVLFTDGQPNDNWQEPARQAREISAKGGLVFLGVGIGSSVDMTTLRAIVPADPGAQLLQGLKFRNFFRWLSDSLRVVSTGSTIQQQVMPSPDDYDWRL